VISPLLANIYLNLLDKAVTRKNGKFSPHNVKIVRYADDFILMGRRIPQQCLDYLKGILTKMELKMLLLTLNGVLIVLDLQSEILLFQAKKEHYNFINLLLVQDFGGFLDHFQK